MAMPVFNETDREQQTEQMPSGQRLGLRAVLAADITGFSGNPSRSEERAAKGLNEAIVTVVNQLQEHGGCLFGMQGYRLTALFDSAVGAVQCAIEIQRLLASFGPGETGGSRIGIHIGEVSFENGLPVGNVMKIAAYLEEQAEPGAILVSGSVMDMVPARITDGFQERGTSRFDDVARPVAKFALAVHSNRSAKSTVVDFNPERTNDGSQLPTGREQHVPDDIIDPAIQETDCASTSDDQLNPLLSIAAGDASAAALREDANSVDRSVATQDHSSNQQIAEQKPDVSPEPLHSELAHELLSPAAPSESIAPMRDAPVRDAEPQTSSLAHVPPSPQCVESLTGVLAVHLGPISKVIVGRCLEQEVSADDLASLLEAYIPCSEGRFLFRVRASHICATFSNQHDDEPSLSIYKS